jgi:hypothetical protein
LRIHRLAVPIALGGLVASAIQEVPVGAALPLEGKLVYAASEGGAPDLWAMDAHGTLRVQLTDTPATHEFDPAWSPDGEQVAFATRRPGNASSDIWVMNADGTGQEQLTQDFGGPVDRQPAWSPSGDRLVWVRSMPAGPSSELWVMNADGTGKHRLLKARPGDFHASPDWSPDGTRIAFVSNRAGGFPELFTIALSSRSLRRLTDTGRIEGNPDWAPDGTAIAFDRRTLDGDAEIWVTDPDGEFPLTGGPGNREQPSWAPDGGAVAYVSSPSGGGSKDLGATSTDGAESESLSSTQGAEITPDWGAGPLIARPPTSTRADTEQPPSSPGGPEAAGLSTRATQIGPGVKLLRGRFRHSDFWALTFNPARASTVDVALAQDRLPGRETVSSMARRHHAMAAITGDFTLPAGQPTHAFAEDGDLKRTSFDFAHGFAISQDEEELYLDYPVETVTVTEPDSGDIWAVNQWNDREPLFGHVAGYSPPGGRLVRPPRHMCSVRLLPEGNLRWANGDLGVVRDHTVDKVVCRARRLGRGEDGVVISAQPGSSGALMIASLAVGESVRLRWWFHQWFRVADAQGGWPLLLLNGERRVEACGLDICGRHPRAGVGTTGAGRVLMVVVDGRRERSLGLTLLQFANLFRKLGAESALNLDGGGSAEIWVRGDVKNRPSDGQERAICCALLILPREDAGEAWASPGGGLFSSAVQPLSPAIEASAAEAALLDPASTGGLLDGWARGLFGPAPPLGPQLRRALHRFRASR